MRLLLAAWRVLYPKVEPSCHHSERRDCFIVTRIPWVFGGETVLHRRGVDCPDCANVDDAEFGLWTRFIWWCLDGWRWYEGEIHVHEGGKWS